MQSSKQNSRDVIHMNARKHLTGFVNASRRARAQAYQRIAHRPIYSRQPEMLNRNPVGIAKFRPTLLGRGAPSPARAQRARRCFLVDPRAIVIAINTRGRQIANPIERARIKPRSQRVKSRVRAIARRGRGNQNMRIGIHFPISI